MYDVDVVDAQVTDRPLHNEYSTLLGYSAKFFAGLLLPKRALCHQKFALTINNLFFIGHPVCTDDDVLSSTKFNLPAAQEGNGSSPALTPPLPLLPPPYVAVVVAADVPCHVCPQGARPVVPVLGEHRQIL